jgi:hypothetical protein
MSVVSVELPESLHSAAGVLAQESGVSMSQLMASALAEKVSVMTSPEWFATRAARGDRAKFEKGLSHVADVEPEERDRV